METTVLKGRPVAAGIRQEVAARAAALAARGVEARLAIVLVGDDPSSAIYSSSIGKAASKVGIAADLVEVSPEEGAQRVREVIRALNDDPSVSGIIVQQPLPEGIPASVIEEVSPSKDVDGATTASMGLLLAGRESFAPCTPLGVIEILAASGVALPGKHVVIVGRSPVVGRPLASLLLRKSHRGNATVTVCHTATRELKRHTLSGDVVVAAMGRPEAITADMVAEGAVVVDVGVNRVDDPEAERGYRIVGDVAFNEMLGRVSAITPVPGGVGSLTTALLLRNTIEAAERVERVVEA